MRIARSTKIAPQFHRCGHTADELIGLISHDLRAPLGPLALSISAIIEEPAVDIAILELAEAAQGQVQRLARLMGAVVIATRGAPPLRMENFDLVTAVGDWVDQVRQLGASLEVRAPVSCTTRGDAEMLRQAVGGLLDWCLSETDAVILGLTHRGERVDISITPSFPTTAIVRTLPSSLRDAGSVYLMCAAAIFAAHGGTLTTAENGISARLPSRTSE